MNHKTKGILVSIGAFIALIIITIVVSVIVTATSSDGWAGLGAIIMMLFATTVVMVVILIIGIVKYIKDKSEFALGLIYGIVGIFAFGIVFQLLISIYNMIV